jgi:hypothetical protein
MKPSLMRLAVSAALASSLAVAAAVPGPVSASDGRYCKTVSKRYSYGVDRTKVYAHGISCRVAVGLNKEYSTPSHWSRSVNGGSGAAGYAYLRKYPGWKCTSGTGAGSCKKGRKYMSYEVLPG